MNSNAVVWILTKEYFQEVERSAESVLKYLPDSDRILLTPDPYIGKHMTRVVKVNPRQHDYWYLDETYYFTQLHTLPYRKIVFLDSDMLLVNDCSDLWRLLDKYDIAMAHAPTRETAKPREPIPASLVEFCTGIVAFRNNPRIKHLFQEWYDTYLKYYARTNNDQVPLRETLWNTQLMLKVATLSTEYNLRFGLGGHAIKPVKILHGRFNGDYAKVNAIVNSSIHPRVWRQGDFIP